MEIEIKARLKDKDAVMQKLAALGCEFSPVKTQDDMVWVERTGSMDEFLSNRAFVRIRVQDGKKVILTAKGAKTDRQGGVENLVKREHEVTVDSAAEARGILELLGLSEAVRTIKRRQTSGYSGYEICIDEVEDLGSFIELEKTGEKEEAQQIQGEMVEFLATLDVPSSDLVNRGYDWLMLEKKSL